MKDGHMEKLEQNSQLQSIDWLNREHRTIEGLKHSALERAIELGKELIQWRQSIGARGGWMQWIKDNLEFSWQKTNEYIQLAGGEELLQTYNNTSGGNIQSEENEEPTLPGMSIREALKAIGKPKANSKPKEVKIPVISDEIEYDKDGFPKESKLTFSYASSSVCPIAIAVTIDVA
jgi:hypothetical protein